MQRSRSYRKNPKPALTVTPEPKPEPTEAERRWKSQYVAQAHGNGMSVRQVVEYLVQGRFRLPAFQRPYVWTTEQVLALLGSILDGYHIGTLLLWERYRVPPGSATLGGCTFEGHRDGGAYMVVDGQQRLGALAMAFTSGRFAFDFEQRAVVVDQAETDHVLPLEKINDINEVLDWIGRHPDNLHRASYLQESLRDRMIYVLNLPAAWTLNRVLESYRRLNTQGTPMSLEHLEEGLRRAEAELRTVTDGRTEGETP